MVNQCSEVLNVKCQNKFVATSLKKERKLKYSMHCKVPCLLEKQWLEPSWQILDSHFCQSIFSLNCPLFLMAYYRLIMISVLHDTSTCNHPVFKVSHHALIYRTVCQNCINVIIGPAPSYLSYITYWFECMNEWTMHEVLNRRQLK